MLKAIPCWIDWEQKRPSYSYLVQMLDHPQHVELIRDLNVEKSSDDPLENFRQQFANRVETRRIVPRSQIEYWSSGNDRTVLHHFANLALINASENAENSNKTTDQKAPQLYDNPSAKLLWLASYARATANQQALLALRWKRTVFGLTTSHRLPSTTGWARSRSIFVQAENEKSSALQW